MENTQGQLLSAKTLLKIFPLGIYLAFTDRELAFNYIIAIELRNTKDFSLTLKMSGSTRCCNSLSWGKNRRYKDTEYYYIT